MNAITIHADQIRMFGRADRYFLENPVEDFSRTEAVLEGAFSDICFENLLSYLQKNQVRFHSLTFSPSVETVPYCTDYLPSENLIIPEGVKFIKNFTFINAGIKTLELPSTVQKIGERAFINCRIQNIHLAYDNPLFVLKGGTVRNSLTKQVILRTESSCQEMMAKWYGSDRALWRALSEKRELSVHRARYWKDYFESVKPELQAKKVFASVNTKQDALSQLKMLLQSLPDSFGNIFSLPVTEYADRFFPYLMSLQYITEGKQARFYPDQSSCFRSFFPAASTVYCYHTQLLAPESIPVLFNHINDGFEMIIPKLQLFLFFPEADLTLIPAFIRQLGNTLAEHLQKLFALEDTDDAPEGPAFQNDTMQISQNSRQNILARMDNHQSDSDQKIILLNIGKLSALGKRHSFNLTHNWNTQHQIELTFTKAENPAALSFTLRYSDILELTDTTQNLIEKELRGNC